MAEGILTKTGKKKLCSAHAGTTSLPAITQVALGSGGVNESGEVIATTGEEIALRMELLKRDVDSVTFPETTTASYSLRLEKPELAGEKISEMGLYDAEGDLVVYRTFPAKGKDEDESFVFHMDEIF